MAEPRISIEKEKNLLQISNIDIEKTAWIEQYGNDFIIVNAPVFRFRHRHPYKLGQVVAVICEEGSASGYVNLKPYCLKKNRLLVILSGHIMESYEVSEDFKCTYIFMSQSFLSGLNIGDGYKFYESVNNNPCYQMDEQLSAAVHSYIDMTRALIGISDRNPNTGESLRLLTKLFFLNMGWFIHQDAVEKDTNTRHSEVMKQFLMLVKADYKEHRDVEYYASKMHMTAKYMSSLVKKASGKPALQWIEDYVILDAKTQLSSTLNSIQQICYDLNFPTQSFFGRYFKRAVGMSPSDYRRYARISTSVHEDEKTGNRHDESSL